MALLQIAELGRAAPHRHRLAVGIDPGTTNSLVATVRSGLRAGGGRPAEHRGRDVLLVGEDAAMGVAVQDNGVPVLVLSGSNSATQSVVGSSAAYSRWQFAPRVNGDLNNDGSVDAADNAILASFRGIPALTVWMPLLKRLGLTRGEMVTVPDPIGFVLIAALYALIVFAVVALLARFIQR